MSCSQVWAHGVSGGDGDFLSQNTGLALGAYLYLGAKHMVTGVDHLLFLVGVIFFIHQLRQVAWYATCFALGHSLTLVGAVLADVHLNVFLVDAVIGFSVVFKAFDNLGGWQRIRWQPNLSLAIGLFGLCHGFGLATKLQALNLSAEGLVGNMLAFNMGVEIGQLLALTLLVLTLSQWRSTANFARQAIFANWLLLSAGLVLIGQHLTGYWLNS